jgi:hypothetical protein
MRISGTNASEHEHGSSRARIPTKTRFLAGWLLVACVAFATAARGQQDPDAAPEGFEARGAGTVRLDIHAFGSGFDDGVPEFISRYTPLRGYNGDDFLDYYLDLTWLEFDLINRATGRPILQIDRTARAYFNQENAIRFDPEPLRLDLQYQLYRSQRIRPNNLPDPAAAPGQNSILALFNDDSFGRQDFFVRRSDLDVELKLRPRLLGADKTHFGDIDLFYTRSDRDSVRFFDYVTTARLSTGSTPNRVRWRGIDQKVTEDVDRGGIGLSATPFQWIGISYEFYAEKYKHRFGNSTLADVARVAGVPLYGATPPAGSPPGFQNPGRTDFWPADQVFLGFVPSSTKLVNKIKFDKTIGPSVLNFGYANVFLKQDDFTAYAKDRGFERGRIVTHSAFANWNMPLTRSILWNAHFQYRRRDNESTFPALDPQGRTINPVTGAPIARPGGVNTVFDYINPNLDGGTHGAVFGPFIDEIETFKFGTDFTFVLPFASSRLVAGWEREDTSRDLIFNNPLAGGGGENSIDPNEAFVRPDSVKDTFFVNYSARFARNLRFRLKNALTIGDKLGLIPEAETGLKSRIELSYSLPKIWKGVTVDTFYQVRYAENDEFRITSRDGAGNLLSAASQDRQQLFQSAGLTFTIMPSDPWMAYGGYIWHRDRLGADFLQTSARRYSDQATLWVFLPSDRSRYLIESHTAFVGSSYRFSERWTGTIDYSVNAITGQLGSGIIADSLGRESKVDNITHHVAMGLDYRLTKNVMMGLRYGYAVYRDDVQPRFDSGFHTIGLLATLEF